MVIFFERFTVPKFLFLLPAMRGCRKIYVFEPGPPDGRRLDIRRISSVVNFFLKGVRVEKADYYNFPELAWESYEEGLKLLEESSQLIEKMPSAAFLKKFCGSEKIILAIKKLLVMYFCNRVYCLRWFEEIKKKENGETLLILDDNDPFKTGRRARISGVDGPGFPGNAFFNRVKNAALRVIYLFGFILVMALKPVFRGITWSKPGIKEYDYGLPLAWGIRKKDKNPDPGHVPRSADDRFLNDTGELNPKKFLYIYSDWGFFREAEKENNSWIEENGSSYIYENKLGYCAKPYFRNFLKVVRGYFFRELFRPGGDARSVINTHRIVSQYCKHDNFCRYFKVRVFIDRQDYDVKSVIRTIVQNKYGAKNIGIQHSAAGGPKLMPYLAYIFFDRYLIQGPLFRKLYYPYWESCREIIETGMYDADFVRSAIENKSRERDFKKKYENKIVLLLTLYNPKSKTNGKSRVHGIVFFDELFRNLDKILSLHPDITIILRPRGGEDLEAVKDAMKRHERITVENGFTTHELMAYADITIALAQSAVFLAALTNKRKTFAYNSFYIKNLPHRRYGRRLVVERIPELLRNIEDLINGSWGIDDYTYKLINKDFNSASEGDSLEKIKASIADIAGKNKNESNSDYRSENVLV